MNRQSPLRITAALVLSALAAFLVVRYVRGRTEPGERGFFYDASAGRIFIASRTAVPPIRGVDSPEEDGFRAVVIAPPGKTRDKSAWRVAYLEKCSPELKRRMETAQSTEEALTMGRLEAQAHRFVRRVTDAEWHPMNSPEAEVILGEWTRPGPDGATPVVCTP